MTPTSSPVTCQVAVYYFPNWHPSPRNNDYYGLGDNEWTEGSYLEPDTIHGLGYLEAIREVFRI